MSDKERRAPVQGERLDRNGRPPGHAPGTIGWDEHVEAWNAYAKLYGEGQTAERLAQRGGFAWSELIDLLGHEPRTWIETERER